LRVTPRTLKAQKETKMPSRRLLIVIGLIVLIGLALPYLATPLLPAQQGRGPGAAKRCVGITSSVLRMQNPVVTRVYRVFEDGTVETYDDGAPSPQ
jgi:hypothetical protein